jgi:outer membrane protein
MKRTLSLVAFAIAGTLTAPAGAQESLLEIYARALDNDPAIREAEANYLSAAQAKPLARGNILPNIRVSNGRGYNVSESPALFDSDTGALLGGNSRSESYRSNWSVSVNQTVFDWGQFLGLKQADKRVARAEIDFEAAKQTLLLRVAEAYFNVLAAEDNLESAQAAQEALDRQLEQAERRFEVGLIAITDVQQSQAGYDDAVATVIAAERALATQQEFLREIIGDMPPDLAGPMDDLPLLTPEPADADEWVRIALDQNLTLLASRIAADIAEDDIDIQRSVRLPTLSLTTGYNESTSSGFTAVTGQPTRRSSSSPDGYSWQLSLSIPVYTGGLNGARIQQAAHQYEAAIATRERVARQTERQTRDAYLGVIAEIQRVRALRQSVESNRTALRATEAGFEVGTQTTVDVLAAQNSLLRAETTYARSRYDYMLNVLRLKEAAGDLTIADLERLDGWLEP